MKKTLFILASVIVVAFCSFKAIDANVESMIKSGLNYAVEQGYGTQETADEIFASGICQTYYQTLIETQSPEKAMDAAAEIAVAKGWAKDVKSAKKNLKKMIEANRQKIYKAIGL